MTQIKHKKVLLVALNMPHEYSLALHYLKLYAVKEPEVREKAEIDILEIKVSKSMPKIVSRILKRRPDLVAFSCCIWNITRTLKVARLVKLFKL